MEDLDGRLLLQGLVKFAGGLVIVAGLLFKRLYRKKIRPLDDPEPIDD